MCIARLHNLFTVGGIHMRVRSILILSLSISAATADVVQAQPMRQLPGVRPHLTMMQNPPNSRTRPAANMVGLESTDFYGKRGYPKQLGDTVEALTTGGAAAAGATGGVAGNNGNAGVQSAGSSGFQGNTGNQIGQNGGGTILGGVFGISHNPGNGFGGNRMLSPGLTGGGFTGMVPKGFGFGGTPQ